MGLFGSLGGSPFGRESYSRAGLGGHRGGVGMYGILATGLLTYLASHPQAFNNLLGRFQKRGLGHAADSWVSNGPNRPISPQDVQAVLDPEDLQELAQRTGMPPQQAAQGLTEVLPNVVDKLTPHGEVPPPNILQQGINFLRNSLRTN